MARMALYFLLATVTGCATITTGTTQDLVVSTTPPDAACTLSRENKVIATIARTPQAVQVSKSSHPLEISCKKIGFLAGTITHGSEFAGATAGNILLGGVVGVVIDAASGASNNYPSPVAVTLVPDPAQPSVAMQAPGPRSATLDSSVPTKPKTTVETTTAASIGQADRAGETRPFGCPKSGLRVERNDGTRVIYRGTDIENSDICISIVNGREIRSYFNLWSLNNPVPEKAWIALRRMIDAGPGASASFETRANSGFVGHFWKYVGEQSITIEGRPRAALKVSYDIVNQYGGTESQFEFWFDLATGVMLKRRSQQVRGSYVPLENWTILTVESGHVS